MADFPIHTTDSADPTSAKYLQDSQDSYGFIPNLHAVMAESPAMLEAYKTLSGIFDKTDLSATERQLVLLTTSRLNRCGYCMAAHSTVAQMQKVPDDVIQSLRDGTPIADPKLEALRGFTVKMHESRGWPEHKDIEALIAAGYSKRTVLEVVLGLALKVLSNYTNHVADTALDKPFASNEWAASVHPVDR